MTNPQRPIFHSPNTKHSPNLLKLIAPEMSQASNASEDSGRNSLGVPKPAFPARGSQQIVSGGRSNSVFVPCASPLIPQITRPQTAKSSKPKPGSGRKKGGLEPGHSLMDWIRLTKSGKDLSSTKGKMIAVSPEELAKHNTETDCWIAFRGLVYNVTPYMEFHPGGADELMRAAGTDGTQLFDEVHQWVNLENMMSSTLVGKLVGKPILRKEHSKINLDKGGLSLAPPMALAHPRPPPSAAPSGAPSFTSLVPPDADSLKQRSASVVTTSSSTPSITVVDSVEHIKTDWFQSGLKVVLVIFTPLQNRISFPVFGNRSQTLSPSNLVVTKDGLSFRIDVIMNEGVSVLHWHLHDSLDEEASYEFKFKPGGAKVEIILKKAKNTHWTSFGLPGPEHSSFNLVPNPDHFWRVKLESISPHTHDTFLLDCRFPSGNYLNPPAGAHVFLRRRIGAGGGGATAVLSSGGVINDGGAEEGKLVSRPYTPIHPSFEEGNVKNLDGTRLSFLIKSYEFGEFTSSLDTMRSGGDLEMGVGFYGNIFSGLHSFPEECTRVCMLAAGTGITPMTGILAQLLPSSSPPSSPSKTTTTTTTTEPRSADFVHLVFFNKTRSDILMSSSWEKLEDEYPKRFRMDHVLSKPEPDWTGLKGRIDKDMLLRLIQDCDLTKDDFKKQLGSFVFVICGSPEFNMAAENALEALQVDDEKIHVFA